MKTMDAKILALYLGCECKTFAFGDSGNFKTIFKGIELRGDGYESYVVLGDGRTLNAGEIKLLLRPLSSMTYQEKTECRLDLVQDIVVNDFQKYDADKFRWEVKQFQYLLSKGFDLFGLIEKGEAIDSTNP